MKRWRFLAAAVASMASGWTEPAAAADESATGADEDYGAEWVWLDGRAGYQHLDLLTFQANDDPLTAGLLPTNAGGPALGLGAGVRLWFVTLGPRLRLGMFEAPPPRRGRFEMWSLDGELGFRIPLGRVEPHLAFAAGYSGFGGIDDVVEELGSAYDVHGANARASFGLDVFLTPAISLGADVSGELLILSRPGVPLDRLVAASELDTLNDAEARILEADGSSTGTSVTVMAGPGFHF